MAKSRGDAFAAATHTRKNGPENPHGDTAVIYEGELGVIARFVKDCPDLETGGDLFGFWTHTGSPVIQYVLGPGKAAKHENTAFYQESAFLQSAGAALHDCHGLQHMGTWHSHHHLSLREPSRGDSSTMQHAIDKNRFSGWLLMICNFAEVSDAVEMRAFLYHQSGNSSHVPLTWILLPGKSPVRAAMETVPDFTDSSPRTVQARYDAIPHTTFAGMASLAKAPSANFPQTSFLTTTDGRAELYRLYEELSGKEHHVDILQRDDDRVAFAFEREGYAFELVFPHSYPVAKPIIEYHPVTIPEDQKDAWTSPRTLFIAMDRGDDVIGLVEDLIGRFLTSREHSDAHQTESGEHTNL